MNEKESTVVNVVRDQTRGRFGTVFAITGSVYQLIDFHTNAESDPRQRSNGAYAGPSILYRWSISILWQYSRELGSPVKAFVSVH